MLIGIDASRALRARRTGTERYALEIIQHLLRLPEAAAHHWRLYVDVLPATAFFPHQTVGSTHANVELRLLPARRLWTHRALGREVVRNAPDVLFVPAHVLPLRLPPRRLPAGVVTIHDLGYHYFPAAHTPFQRYYLPWSSRWSAWVASQVIAVSQSTADDLARFYGTPPAKVTVIHEATTPIATSTTIPLPADAVRRQYGLPERYALYVGTLQPRKNLARLLYAYQRLQVHTPVWDLVLAGAPGPEHDVLAQLAVTLDVAAHVHFLGYVADEALPVLYQCANFFCFPSLFEGFGLPLLEAQSYGVPVMCANNSSLPEIAGDAALLVDPTDVEALAAAMLRLSQDEALRQQLIAAGYENVKRFSWAKAARETLAVLESAARAKR
ncbi:MAG: glycosyltransferase family 1 protein [Caldilineaceae bacterium]